MKSREKVCGYCGRAFVDLSYHNKRIYCDKACAYRANNGRPLVHNNGRAENPRHCLDCRELMRFGNSPYCEDCDPTFVKQERTFFGGLLRQC